ncbi:acyl-CoA thioesterase [Jatrophihabitans sp. DSM 45814]
MRTLVDFLDLDRVGPDHFISSKESPLSRPTLFGGALIAQALRAAAATTASEVYPNSLHATFLRAGQSGADVHHHVERTRDGRSFASRQVRVAQGERTIMTMTASFHRDEVGGEFQRRWPPTPAPPDVRPLAPHEDALGVEVVDLTDATATAADLEYLAWARSAHPLADDRVLQCCVLAYISDTGAPAVAAAAIGVHAGGPNREAGSVMTTSLDHAMWFHRPGRADDWLLIRGIPVSTARSRGLVLGSMFDRSGAHLASFTQELLIRH